MIVLGFDTSTASTAVALWRDGAARELRDDPPREAHPGHATRLLAMAAELLAGAGLQWRELDRIAVGVGPGTFTGLRVGVATARGLAQSLSLELAGVSSLSALAAPALAQQDDVQARVLAVIDARRGEVFAAVYEAGEEEPAPLSAPRALPPQELAALVADLGGGDAGAAAKLLAVGDGAVRYREQLEAAGIAVAAEHSALNRVSAKEICAAGARAPTAGGVRKIVPDYRRRPDAELALEVAGGERGVSG
jgi:tRNA threonylcarbamoyladenosine biosynthesis protein TsaB